MKRKFAGLIMNISAGDWNMLTERENGHWEQLKSQV